MRTALQTRVSQTLHDERQSPSLEQPPKPQLVHLLAVHQDFKKRNMLKTNTIVAFLDEFEACMDRIRVNILRYRQIRGVGLQYAPIQNLCQL